MSDIPTVWKRLLTQQVACRRVFHDFVTAHEIEEIARHVGGDRVNRTLVEKFHGVRLIARDSWARELQRMYVGR